MQLLYLTLSLLCLTSCSLLSTYSPPDIQPLTTANPAYTIFASGLNQPRGMVFDAAGNLYVAEAGARDAPSPGEAASQDPDQKLPDLNHSGRVLRIAPNGQITTVLDGLPYVYYPDSGDVGATDVVVHAGQLYLLTSEGYDDNLSRMVLRVPSGDDSAGGAEAAQRIANIRRFVENMTPMEDQMLTGGAASNPYAMVVATGEFATKSAVVDVRANRKDEQDAAAGRVQDDETNDVAFFVSDGATGRVLRITLDGKIRIFAELPDLLPIAGLTLGPDDRLYVTMFSERPHMAGSGALWAAGPDGVLTLVAQDLTMPIDVDFSPRSGNDLSSSQRADVLYILEFGSNIPAQQLYAPDRGRLLRLMLDSDQPIPHTSIPPTPIPHTVVLEGLDYPTAMTFAPNGDLYIAVGGAFTGAGQGSILKMPCQTLGIPDACQ